MNSNFKHIKLGTVCLKIGSGATPRGGKEVYLDHGEIVLIRSQNVYNDGFKNEGLAYITEKHASQLSNVAVEKDDVLLNITGDSVARCCQVNINTLPARVNQHVAIIRPDSHKLDPRYLRYFLVSAPMQDLMLSWAGSGGTRNALTKGMIESFEIPCPEVSIQRSIAHILGTLDDKIELNRAMNETLEEMARAIFKSWFVDFDPVRAKAEGRKPFGMDADTAALFPASFQDSPIGKIPKDWTLGCLGDIAKNKKVSVKPHQLEDYSHYIGLEHMPRRCISLAEWGLSESVTSNKYAFNKGDLLFGKLRPYFHKVGIAAVDGVCSTDILVVVPKKPEWFGYTLEIITSDEFVGYTDMASTGTKMPRTNWTDMSNYETVLPPTELAEAFSKFITPMTEKIISNIHESQTLAAIRDALLPKLMSGEVRVNSLETVSGDKQ
ncbi:MAG TPA: restriction endonuclease subunit S [candidate division Zixibacteria bacterium]|nr:restriction endonuclease subunit S [candidate division Zixibacteria bacterium]